MDFTVNNGAIQFPTKKGTTKAFCFSIGSVEGVFSYSGTRLYDLKGGYPHTVNGVSVDSYHDFQDEFLKFGGILPPNLSQSIQFFDGTTYESEGVTYLEDKSVEGGEVQMVRSISVGNGVDNSVNTGILFDDDTDFDYRFRIKDISFTQVIGGGATLGKRAYVLYLVSGMLRLGWGAQGDVLMSADTEVHSYRKIGMKYYIDDNVWDITSSTSNILNGGLFSTYTAEDNPVLQSNIELHHAYVWRFGILVGSFEGREKFGDKIVNKVTGEAIQVSGDTSNFRQPLTLLTPELVENYSEWRTPANDLIRVPFKTDGTPSYGEGDTFLIDNDTVACTWIKDVVNPVTKGWTDDGNGGLFYQDRYDAPIIGDTITQIAPYVISRGATDFTNNILATDFTLAEVGVDYEGKKVLFAGDTKLLYYASARTTEEIEEIQEIIG